MSVSVIVPVYNAAPWLEACLESLRCQTLSDLEVIIVDDGSTDGSIAIGQKYATTWPKHFRHISLSHMGIGRARNMGLAAACKDFVGFVDSDDSVLPHMFQCLYDAVCEAQAQVAVCGMCIAFPRRTKIVLPEPHIRAEDMLKNSQTLSPPWNKIYSRAFLCEHNIHFPESSMSEDMAFAFKVMVNEPKIVCVQEALYIYNKHEGNITFDITRRKETLSSIEDIKKYLIQKGKLAKYKKHYRYVFFMHLLYYPLCLLCIDSLLKGHSRWHNIQYAPAYFYALCRFCLTGDRHAR